MRNRRQGWRSVRLADVGRWWSGGTPSTAVRRYWDGDIPWISAASLKEFEIRDSERRITRLAASTGSRLVPAGTVLFVVRGMSLKSEFRVGVTQREVAFGQDCKAILPSSEVDARFLAYSLVANSGRILKIVDEAGHGTGRLSTDQLSKVTVGVPDKSEQRHIVEVLESVDESIRATDYSIAKKRLIRRGIMLALLQHDHTRQPLGTVVSRGPQNGLYKEAAAYGASGTPIVRIDSFDDGKVHSIGRLKRVQISPLEAKLYGLRAGDLLVNRVNTIDLVGKSAIVPPLNEATVFESNIMRLTVSIADAMPQYVGLWLCGPEARSHFLRSAKSAIGQASINQGDVMACPISIPSLDEQLRITSVISSADEQIAEEEDRLAKLRRLRQGLAEELLIGQARMNAGEEF